MKKHIVCFGDSNTHGYNGDTLGRFDENERWTCLLQKLLGDDYLVLEEGLSGRTTVFDDPLHECMSGLDSIYSCLMSHEPVDLLIIMLGTNDTKERFSVTPEAIGIGMQRLIKKAKALEEAWRDGKANILIVTPKNIDDEYEQTECAAPMGLGCAKRSRGLHDAFKQAAELLSCHYLNANDYVSNNNKTDYMHIDLQGHKELANALCKKIKEII